MSRLQQAFDAGKFVVTSELNPPKGTELGDLLAKADALKDLITAFNLTDCHSARMAAAPMAVAHLLLDRGIEPILQMTARDRNRIALQSDMLAASLLGVSNMVFMGGDPPTVGDHPEAKPVFDILSAEMLNVATGLQNGKDMTGHKLKGAPQFCLGAVVNPGASDLDGEIQRMVQKIEAGVTFLQSQAVYDVDSYARFAERAARYDVKILAGVIPLKSMKMARYLHDKVPGIDIPERLFKELSESADPLTSAVDIAARTIRQIKPLCHGVHIMAIGWEDHIPAILERAAL